MNVHPPDNRFQVDVGPVLYPGSGSKAAFLVERLQLAYAMYNEFDGAEFALRVPTRGAAAAPGETLHYSEVVKRLARHQVVNAAEWAVSKPGRVLG